jgi:DNA invertase Pin-like site-specific DNA recombinase
MFEVASRREFDVLLVWSLDRFSRQGIAKTFDHLKLLHLYGVKFRSFSESFLDTTGDFADPLRAIFAFTASFERKPIVERITAGLERARAEGKEFGRKRVIFDRTKVWR